MRQLFVFARRARMMHEDTDVTLTGAYSGSRFIVKMKISADGSLGELEQTAGGSCQVE